MACLRSDLGQRPLLGESLGEKTCAIVLPLAILLTAWSKSLKDASFTCIAELRSPSAPYAP
jgi:hypothetical protein